MLDVSDRSVRTSRRRGLRPALALLVGGAMVLSGTAAGSLPAGAARAPGSFSTSFEVGDPAALASTVETGTDGKPARGGVMGATGHLPGSVIDASTPIAATATLTFHLAAPVAVSTYALTSASDAPDRDPAA